MTYSKRILIFIFISTLGILLVSLKKFYSAEFGYEIYFQYVTLFTILLILQFFCFFVRETIRQNILLIFFSTIFISYIIELILPNKKLFKNKNIAEERIKVAKKQGREYDKRSSYEVVKSSVNEIIYPYIHPSEYINKNGISIDNKKFFPFAGISKSKTILCNESGDWVFYDSDVFGFNNNPSPWEEDNFDAVLIGDSYLHGACVREEFQLANLIKKNKFKILNLGYSGNGTLLNFATLLEYTRDKSFKNIYIFHYEGNDIRNLSQELNSQTLLKYLENTNFTQKLKDKQKYIDSALKIMVKEKISNIEKDKKELNEYKKNSLLFNNYNLKSFIKLTKVRSLIFRFNVGHAIILDEKIFTYFSEIMEKTLQYSKSKNANIIFYYLPAFERYNSFISEIVLNQEKNKIFEVLNEKNIQVVDFSKKFYDLDKNPKKFFPFELFGHYNEIGYKKIADDVIKRLKN